jgi:L-amino acid N-acyltransferase YncA
MEINKYSNSHKSEIEGIFRIYWTDPEYLQELNDALASENFNFYVALDNDEVVGVAGIRKAENFLKEYTTTTNPVELYIIASKNKNKGTGGFLFNYVEKEYIKMNYSEIICYSPETHNSSWRFYQKSGFIQRGIVNDPEDGYPGMVWRKML